MPIIVAGPSAAVGALRRGEAVTIFRDGSPIGILAGGIDPAANKIYVGAGADVLQGDTAAFRGVLRRIIQIPQVWLNPFTGRSAGTVLEHEDAPAFMPDLGLLERMSVAESWDGSTLTPAVWVTAWSGAVHVEPSESEGALARVAEQGVGVVPFLVHAPLALEDVRPEDRLTVTSSRDGRLETVTLNVTHVVSGSSFTTRQFRAIENQG
jgi:hypothetical protein